MQNRDEMEEGFLITNYGITQETLELAGPYVDMSPYEAVVKRYQSTAAQMYHDSLYELQGVFQDVYRVSQAAVPKIESIKQNYLALDRELKDICDLIRPIDGDITQMKLFTLSPEELRDKLLANSANTEKAYDLLMQKRVFALMDDPDFSEAAWKKCKTLEDKEAFLKDFFERVKEIMGLSDELTLEFPERDHPKGYLAAHSRKGTIYLYPQYTNLMNNFFTGTSALETIMRALLHEARHAYQWESVIDWSRKKWIEDGAIPHEGYPAIEGYEERNPYVSEETAKIWQDNFAKPMDSDVHGRQAYLESPIEWDANNFSGLNTPKNESLYYDLNPQHPGSWNVQEEP